MKNKIEDLRNHLFETLEALKDADRPMEVERAGAIANVAKVLIDSAKVEVDLIKATSAARGTGFIPVAQPAPAAGRLSAGSPSPEETPRRRCVGCSQLTQRDPCEHCGQAWGRSA